MKDFSYITNSHPEFIENLYKDFLNNPSSVDPELKKFFEGFDFAIGNGKPTNGSAAIAAPATVTVPAESVPTEVGWKKELGAYRMILGYRNKGHLIAKTNPIRERKDRDANLNLGFFGLTDEDLDKTFRVGDRIGIGATSLKNIVAHLQKVYADHVGIEYKYISNQDKVTGWRQKWKRNFLNHCH
ncbi:MAG: hypothetical protein WDN26_23860 [Chitinophagaceae bacterium]